ncbi:MAG: hypothetical protein R2813_04945 [Flavobacteriales bacterium]
MKWSSGEQRGHAWQLRHGVSQDGQQDFRRNAGRVEYYSDHSSIWRTTPYMETKQQASDYGNGFIVKSSFYNWFVLSFNQQSNNTHRTCLRKNGERHETYPLLRSSMLSKAQHLEQMLDIGICMKRRKNPHRGRG